MDANVPYEDDSAMSSHVSELAEAPMPSTPSVPMVNFFQGPSSEDPWFPHTCVDASVSPHQHGLDAASCGQLTPRVDVDYASLGSTSDCATLPGDSGYGGSHEAFSMSSATSIYSGGDEMGQVSQVMHGCQARPVGTGAVEHRCLDCQTVLKSQGELKKHRQRHLKPHVCPYQGCSKGKRGFSTANDLVRHKRSVHGDHSLPGRSFVCLHCNQGNKKPKIWPRADNFRQHLKRSHHIELNASDDHDKYMYQNDLEGVGSSVDAADARYRPASLAESSSSAPLCPSATDFPAVTPQSIEARHSANEAQFCPDGTRFPPNDARFPPHGMWYSAPALNQVIVSHSEAPSKVQGGQQQLLHTPSTLAWPECATASYSTPTQQAPMSYATYSHYHGSQAPKMDAAMDLAEQSGSWKPNESGFSESLQLGLGDGSADEATGKKLCRRGLARRTLLKGTPAYGSAISRSKTVQSVDRTLPPALLVTGADANREESEARNQIPCPNGDCRRTFRRLCELKKHQKRHDKPYGCTFENCNKRFGSKDDWKRHESSQHAQLETWHCHELHCGRVFHRREDLKHHLQREHGLGDARDIDGKLEAHRQGRHCQPRFWCGFCVHMVDIDSGVTGSFSLNERFDHIDNHLSGKAGLVRKSIGEWKHQGEGEELVEWDTRGGDVSGTGVVDSGERRRPSSLQGTVHQDQHKTNYMWDCCMCSAVMNYHTSVACAECNHHRCFQGCTVGFVASPVEEEEDGFDELGGSAGESLVGIEFPTRVNVLFLED